MIICLFICLLGRRQRISFKLRLPICEIWCEIFQLFRSLVYFILPFTDVRKFSDRK